MNSTDVWSFYEAIGEADRRGLTPQEEQVAAICDLRQEINSGGFDGYFRYWGGNTAPTALSGLRALLGEPWAALLEDALALFGDTYPSNQTHREELLDRLDLGDALDELDSRFYDLESSTDADERLTHALRR
ncbi:DUF4375 domain-containing protein [Janibacter indicus]|uniref:DUF4375 domain-containing protein n=1 Tax=Janibacter indicus TaxID=857417 RepID=A0A7L9J3K5_9MICO|nr:DUF4375 domain-containing protein [Janibacter indicus]QOK24201.1 DUF4375 domain-containing protein [Janibacter indicus]